MVEEGKEGERKKERKGRDGGVKDGMKLQKTAIKLQLNHN